MDKLSKITLGLLLLLTLVGCGVKNNATESEVVVEVEKNIKYGLDADRYKLKSSTIKSGETLGKILNSFGLSAVMIDRLDRASKDIFPLRNIRADQNYTAFIATDSLNVDRLEHLVYEINIAEYVKFGFMKDSVSIVLESKPYSYKRQKKSAVISSSLWGAIMEKELPYALAAELEDVYQWTVDFFGIQKGDNFTVIYDEKFIDDSLSVGIGKVHGAIFTHNNKEYYAIPYQQGDNTEFWEFDGASLRKQLLKAPLKFSRISSKFSNRRLHPVYKVYRPHHGVDYAAPMGTPVLATADGVVTLKGNIGANGNILKIKHPGNLMTGYLHLSKFARGIQTGSKVVQGEVIAYVGSTGASTGPHLDYRIWKNGVPIDPLKIPQKSMVPIAKENKVEFESVRDRVIAELKGDVEKTKVDIASNTASEAKSTI